MTSNRGICTPAIQYTSLLFLFVFTLLFLAENAQAFQATTPGEKEVRDILNKQSGKFEIPASTSTASDSSDQEEKPNPWTKTWNLNINGNQASYRNWSQGGVNTIATSASTLARFKYSGGSFSNTVRINLQYGQTWLDGEGSKKTADLINLRYKLDYFLGSYQLSTFTEIDFRTQFVDGYDEDNENIVSDFMAPGYLTESIGLSYQPDDYFSVQSGLGLKQTFVSVDSLGQYYGLDEDEKIRSEGGLTVSINWDKSFAKTFNYTTELSTFTNLLLPVRRTDIIFRNSLSGKLNSFLSTILQFELMYDDDVTTKLQMRQSIAVGLIIKLL